MALVNDSAREFTITEKSLIDDSEIRKAIIYDVSKEFLETFVLRKPGDYCVSKALNGSFYLSILIDHKKTPGEEADVVHLPITVENGEKTLDGMLFARAKTLGALIYNLVDHQSPQEEFLAGVLEKNVKLGRLVGISKAVTYNIHQAMQFKDKKVLKETYDCLIYTARMEMSDGSKFEMLFEEKLNLEDSAKAAFLKTFFEQLVLGADVNANKLPIRLPVGAILQPPTLIYHQKKLDIGFSLDTILKQFDDQLDLTQRIKLCSSAVRVMSELHHADVYHGAVKTDNFFAQCLGAKDGVKQYELVFNGASGLLCDEKSDNTMEMTDYDSNAPELAFTRKLTKETGVFNIGRLFEQILKTEILKTYTMNPDDEPRALREMRRLIEHATRPNPQHRPTMHGVVIMIREVLMALPQSTAPVNFVHYDQFLN